MIYLLIYCLILFSDARIELYSTCVVDHILRVFISRLSVFISRLLVIEKQKNIVENDLKSIFRKLFYYFYFTIFLFAYTRIVYDIVRVSDHVLSLLHFLLYVIENITRENNVSGIFRFLFISILYHFSMLTYRYYWWYRTCPISLFASFHKFHVYCLLHYFLQCLHVSLMISYVSYYTYFTFVAYFIFLNLYVLLMITYVSHLTFHFISYISR